MKHLTRTGRTALGLLLVAFLGGCASRYDVTLRNGDVIRTSTKPVLNERGYYVFKDVTGEEKEVNSMRVRQIEPARHGTKSQKEF